MNKVALVAVPLVVVAGTAAYMNRGVLGTKLDEAFVSQPADGTTLPVDTDGLPAGTDAGPVAGGPAESPAPSPTPSPTTRPDMEMTEDGALQAGLKVLRELMRRDPEYKSMADMQFKTPRHTEPYLRAFYPSEVKKRVYSFAPGGDGNGPPHYYLLVTSLPDGYHVVRVELFHKRGKVVIDYTHSAYERNNDLEPVK